MEVCTSREHPTQRTFSFRCRESEKCLAAAKHLKKLLKEKERARATLSQNRKGFPSRGRFAAFLAPTPLAVNPLDALAYGFVAVCESRLACRFEWFASPHGQASLECIECLRRSRASALPSCGGTCGRNPSCRSQRTRHSAERIRLMNRARVVGQTLTRRAFVRLGQRLTWAVLSSGCVALRRPLRAMILFPLNVLVSIFQ